MKNKRFYLLSFFIPIFIVLLALLFTNELNKEAFIISDMKNQYIGFFAYLKNIDSITDLFYSFSKGLGGNMLPDFFYYLSSPLNILLFLPIDIITIISIIILLKFGICGLTSYLFFKTKIENKYALLFSLCYSLSSYMINFYFNTMWIDAVYMLPLILIGVDRLINEKGSSFYIGTLFLSMLFNYYVTFSTCIFLILYFLYESILNNILSKKLIIKFIFSSIISVLLASFVILPIIVNIINISRPIDFQSLTSFKDFIEGFLVFIIKLFPCTNNVNTIEGVFTFNIYSSLLSLVLFILFLNNKEIEKKEKILTFLVLGIFIFSFLLNPLSYIWHGFSYPSAFFFRFSYLFIFFIIYIFSKQIKYKINRNNFILASFILFLFLIICYFYNNLYNSNFIYLSFLLITFYLFIIYNKEKLNSRYFYFLILIFTIIELFVNTSSSLVTKKEYQVKKDYYPKNINNDKSYLRTNNIPFYSFNDNFIYQTKGTMYSSSNIPQNIKNFYYKIGAYSTNTSIYLSKNNKVIYNLLGINDGSIGYQAKNLNNINYINQFDYQNKFIKNITGLNDNIFNTIDLNKINNCTYGAFIPNEDDLYLSVDINFTNYVYKYNIGKIYINDKFVSYIDNYSHNFGIIKIKNKYKNKSVKIKLEIDNENIKVKSLNLAYVNRNNYDNYINYLDNNKLNITYFNNNKLAGNIKINNNSYLFLSIPYDKNWNIYIDNKKIKPKKVLNTFIGFKIDNGYHQIRMIYIPKEFIIGLIISFTTFIGLIIHRKTRN